MKELMICQAVDPLQVRPSKKTIPDLKRENEFVKVLNMGYDEGCTSPTIREPSR
jgi:hypothetical protein